MICTITLIVVAGCTSTTQVPPVTPVTPTITQTAVPTTVMTTEMPTTIVPVNATPVATTAAPFKTFTSVPYSFSIGYPANWDFSELNRSEPSISSSRVDVVEFYSPSFLRCNSDKSDCVNVRAEVKVEADAHPSSTDLDAFFVKDVARITTQNNIEITKRDAMFKLAGDKAYRLDFKSADSASEHIHALSAYTIRNGVAYIITYHGHDPERQENTSQFEQYYNDAMSMFGSFTPSGGIYKTI